MARTLAFLALLAATLAACAGTGGVTVSRVDVRTLYSPGLVQWAAAGRDLPLRVTGNPTRVAPEAWEAEVAGALNATGWLPQATITPTPGPSMRGNFHLAVAFNVPAMLSDAEVCRGDVASEALLPADGRSLIAMAFCNDDRPVSGARASTAAILAPGAPQMQAAMSQLIKQVMPRQDPGFPDRADVILPP